MYELLCTARTRGGQQTLAAWLLAPASIQEIQARQEAIKELAPLIDFREQLELAGEDIRIGVHPEALTEWSESPSRLSPRFARMVAPLLATVWILSLLAWAITGFGAPALLMTLINLMVTYRTRTQVEKSAAAIEQAMHELDLLAGIFRQIETQSFTSKKLLDLQNALQVTQHSHHRSASEAITRLHKRVDWLESNENPIIKFADLFIFWTAQWSAAIEAWRTQHGAAVRRWLAVVGEIEALNAFAAYAYEHPADVFPQFIESATCLNAEAFAHPLIPASRAVTNSLKLDSNLQLVVISGPNMAGKSTFIRSVGVNVVLAQAGAPVRARSMVLSPLTVAASICVLDSLQGGLSRFYAEILRLKLIDEQSRRPTPVLFLLDELLSGTNSHDRRVGTESFVRTLLARGAIGLVTTHDLALAEIAEKLPGQAANFHFEDSFESGELRFDYRLTPGIVSTTNALKLMRSVGLEV
ncbi:MAG: mismatch repair protein [Acidobacteriales bacterium]|nr:mismatch repair protein [Terriglobales bacterium]